MELDPDGKQYPQRKKGSTVSSLYLYLTYRIEKSLAALTSAPLLTHDISSLVLLFASTLGPSRNFFCQSEGLRRNPNQTVFHINKGVRCLTYSGKANVVITGGLDRVVRLWNPYVNLRPSGTLQGHGAPIEHVCVQDTCDRVFSYASDHELRVWDLSDLQCLVTVSYRRHGITSDVTASYFHDRLACLILSADQHHVISLRAAGRGSRHTTSHDAAVTCATYNERFSHLISGSSDGVIKVWEVATGGAAFEFVASETKDSEEKLSPLTDCVIDTSKRRLFTAQVRVTTWGRQLLLSFGASQLRSVLRR